MAVISYPFESLNTGTVNEPVYDRAITAEDERLFNRLRYTNGVFAEVADGLKVSANGNMSVTVGTGGGSIEGALFYNTAPLTLAFDAADATLNRIDRVVAQFNTSVSVRAINIAVRTGVSATNPVAPELRREPNFYEIALADISVKKGMASISTSAIKDQRLNSDLCGMVIAAIPTPINTSDLWSQYEASLNEWLDTVASALDGTLAGNLQNQIAGLGERLTAEENRVQPIEKGGTGADLSDVPAGAIIVKSTTENRLSYYTAAEALAMLGGTSIDLLWENASPGSTFPAQKISLDMAGYDSMVMVYKGSASSAYQYAAIGRKVKLEATLNIASSSAIYFSSRNVAADSSGVEIGGAAGKTGTTGTLISNTTESNKYSVPIKIYGVKFTGSIV